MLRIRQTCTNISQLRRRPNTRLNNGIFNRSAAGAQTHLKPYARVTQLKKPIVARSTPASRNHTDKLEKTNKIGNPAEKPKKNKRMT